MARARNNIVVEVDAPIEDTLAAMQIIKIFRQKNKLNFDLSIAYDFDFDGQGVYFPLMRGQSHRIFVNPFNCKNREDVMLDDSIEPFCPGYTSDLTLFGVTLHEFCHFLTYQIFKGIMADFTKTFPTERLYLNEYCNNEFHDELAELLTLYMTNPYLLKLISQKHWKFCKSYFKSPVACTKEKLSYIYHGFPVHVKDHMRDKWGFIYNICTEEFEKV